MRQIAERVDQVVPMMYDTAIKQPKFYRQLMFHWTTQVLDWSGDTPVLLGIPAYEDANVKYHFPKVENLRNSLLGVHAGLSRSKILPNNYAGIAIYCEWEMNPEKWEILKRVIRE